MSIFTTVKTPKVPLNKFNLSHDVKFTASIGKLYPILCQEIVPGDRFRITSDMLVRLMPMSSPAFGNLKVYTHFFFVPNRLLWDPWEEFITGGEDGASVVVPPYASFKDLVTNASTVTGQETNVGVGLLSDYLGIPVSPSKTIGNETPVSLLPFYAYWQIYNDYYRDQNVMPELTWDHSFTGHYPLGTNGKLGNISGHLTELGRRCFLKDYFTSALPTPQRGPDVTLPIGGLADVVYDQSSGQRGSFNNTDAIPDPSLRSGAAYLDNRQTSDPTRFDLNLGNNIVPPFSHMSYDPNGTLKADLTGATAVTINDLRRAISLQKFYEISARSGSRYIEQIYGHFHVRSSDARLQRSEYLGGGVTPVQIGEVLQTSATDATSPQANMAGRGVGFARTNKAVFRAEEHGYIIGITSIIPDATYFQGIGRSWSRISRDDYYWPSFANLGEQPIEKQELVATGVVDNYGHLFGYAPRYAEYKFNPNRLAGLMRTELSNWTFARELTQANLNSSFLEVPSINNPFAVQDDTDKFVIWCSHRIDALRPMPYFGTPSI